MTTPSRLHFFDVSLSTGARHAFNLANLSRVEFLGEGPGRIVRVFSISAPPLELAGEDVQAFVEGFEAARHNP